MATLRLQACYAADHDKKNAHATESNACRMMRRERVSGCELRFGFGLMTYGLWFTVYGAWLICDSSWFRCFMVYEALRFIGWRRSHRLLRLLLVGHKILGLRETSCTKEEPW